MCLHVLCILVLTLSRALSHVRSHACMRAYMEMSDRFYGDFDIRALYVFINEYPVLVSRISRLLSENSNTKEALRRDAR